MRKFIKSAIIRTAVPILSAVLMFSQGYSNKFPNPETLVPASTILFVKSSPVKTLVKSANYMLNSVYSDQEKKEFMTGMEEYKNKSGIDPLNTESLVKAGIDIDRTAAVAYMGSDVQGGEKLIVMLPVQNEKTFPQKFIEVIKKTSGDQFLDTYPAVTKHGSATIYQVQKDVFGTAFDGYFFIAPTGDTIKEIIDLKAGKSPLKPLAIDPNYADYLKKSKNNLDINVFMKKEFLDVLAGAVGSMFNKPVPEPGPEPDGDSDSDDDFNEGGDDNPFDYEGEEGQSFNFLERFLPAMNKKAGMIPVQYQGPQKQSSFEGVDYAAMSFGMGAKKMVINAGVSFNAKNPMVAMFLELLQTGKTSELISMDKISSYGFLSLNLSHLEGLCMNPIPGCQEYTTLKAQINEQLGIDISKDFLPYYSGVFNFVSVDAVKGKPADKTVIFLPMTDEAKTEALMKTVTAKVVKDLAPANTGGAVKIGGKNGFWVASQEQKLFVAADKRGIYIATTSETAAAAMKSPLLSAEEKSKIKSRIKATQFFLMYASRDIYKGPMAMAAAPDMQKFADKMGDIYFSADRVGGNIAFELEIEIIDKKKDK